MVTARSQDEEDYFLFHVYGGSQWQLFRLQQDQDRDLVLVYNGGEAMCTEEAEYTDGDSRRLGCSLSSINSHFVFVYSQIWFLGFFLLLVTDETG